MKGYSLNIQRVIERPANVLQQHRSLRNKIRDALLHIIHMEIRIGTSKDQIVHPMLSLSTVLGRPDTILVGSNKLYIVIVGEGVRKIGN